MVSKFLFDNSAGLLQSFNTTLENTVRFNFFNELVKAGVNPKRAAAASKDLSVDFNRKGSDQTIISAHKFFYNAGVQGSERVWNSATQLKPKYNLQTGAKREPLQRLTGSQKLLFGSVAFGASLTQWNMAVSGVDNDGVTHYDKIPDGIKMNNMVIFYGPGSNDYIAIPLPYGYGAMHNLGVGTSEYAGVLDEVVQGPDGPMIDFGLEQNYDINIAERGSQKTAMDAALFITSSFYYGLTPVGSFVSGDERGKENDPITSGLTTIVGLGTPDFAKPALEVLMNNNHWGKDIYAESVDGVARSEQGRTSPALVVEFFKLLNDSTGGTETTSGNIDINPDLAMYLFNSYAGGLGALVDQGSGFIMDQKQLDLLLEADSTYNVDEGSWALDPWTSRFFKEVTEYDTYGKYYDAKVEVESLIAEFGNPEDFLEVENRALPWRLSSGAKGEDYDRYNGAWNVYKTIAKLQPSIKTIQEGIDKLVEEQERIGTVHMFSSDEDILQFTQLRVEIEALQLEIADIMDEALNVYYMEFPKKEE